MPADSLSSSQSAHHALVPGDPHRQFATRRTHSSPDLPVGAQQCHSQRERGRRRPEGGPSYLLGFHQHLEKHREAPGGEQDLLPPAALSVAGGVLQVPAVLPAHFLHYHLGRKETVPQSRTLPKPWSFISKGRGREGEGGTWGWGWERERDKKTDGHISQRPALAKEREDGWFRCPLQGETHRLVSEHRPDVWEGLPQHQLDLEGLEAYSKETQAHTEPPQPSAFPQDGRREEELRGRSDGKAALRAPKPTAHAQDCELRRSPKAHTFHCRTAMRPGSRGRSPQKGLGTGPRPLCGADSSFPEFQCLTETPVLALATTVSYSP